MKPQFRVAKPVPQLIYLRAVVIVQVLSRAKYLHGWYVGIPNTVEPHGGQAVIHEQMRG
jgi:hypothetical protein